MSHLLAKVESNSPRHDWVHNFCAFQPLFPFLQNKKIQIFKYLEIPLLGLFFGSECAAEWQRPEGAVIGNVQSLISGTKAHTVPVKMRSAVSPAIPRHSFLAGPLSWRRS